MNLIRLLLLLGLVAPRAAGVELKVQLGHSTWINTVAFSPDGHRALTSSEDGTARLWDLATGREIRCLTGHKGDVGAAGFSPDGRLAITGGQDKTARLWDLATGREIHRFTGHEEAVQTAAFLPDGKSVITGSYDYTARIWDLATGHEIRRLEGHQGAILSLAVSPDGRFALTGSSDRTVRFWDLATGREIARLTGHTDKVTSVAFSPVGSVALSGSQDERVLLWDLSTGKAIRRFEIGAWVHSVAVAPDGHSILVGCLKNDALILYPDPKREFGTLKGHTSWVNGVAFSPDGRTALTGSDDKTARLWDMNTGREIGRLAGRTDMVNGVSFSPNGRMVLTGGSDRTARLWDLATGRANRRFEGHTERINSVAYAPDGRSALTGSLDATARLWDVGTGREIRQLKGHDGQVLQVAISPDGRSALSSSVDKTARLWDLASGREMRRLEGHAEWVTAVAFSPDGRSALTCGDDKTARLWSLDTGRETRRLEAANWLYSAAFAPDGRSVITGDSEGLAQLWDPATGRELRRFQGHSETIFAIAVSRDSQTLLTGSGDKTARLWDLASGRQIQLFEGHATTVNSVALSPDGRQAVTGSGDGTAKIWDTKTGALLVTLISFGDGGWAVADPEGRYDASDPDTSPGLYWQLGDEVIELSQLKSRFYTPNLLGRALGFSSEPLPAVAGLKDLQLPPSATLTQPHTGESMATLRLTDRGGGIGRVVIRVNGREVPLLTRGTAVQADTAIPVDLSAAQLAADGENTIETFVYDKANLLSSRGVAVHWKQSPEKAPQPPALHAVIAGVANYEGPSMALKFPAKDALDMAHAIEVGGKRMFGVERTDVAVFASGTDHEPTKENIRKAFEAIAARSGSNDVLLVYLAGHGVAGKAGSDLYYYLTREARSVKPEDDARLWEQTTISSAELLEWLRRKGMPLRQVVVLDTCAAGAATGELLKLADRRELTADQRRALELLKDATGSHILMGAAADKVSYEASRYGQGLLTYSLLSGMRGEALDEGGRLDVTKWFRVAQLRVPDLARGIGGIQQPVISSPGGQTFPIAMFTPEDRSLIVLPKLKPQLLRALVQNGDQDDPLQLEGSVRAELRALSLPATRGESRPEPPLVYLDETAGDVVDAFKPQVLYTVEGNGVRIRLRLVSAEGRREQTFAAPTGDTAALARRIAQEFVRMLDAPER